MLSQARPTCPMQSTFENKKDSYKLNYVEVEIGPPKQGRDDGNPVIRIQQTSNNVNYSTIVFPPKHQNITVKNVSEKDTSNNNEVATTTTTTTNQTTSKPNQPKLPNVVSTNGPLSLPPTTVVPNSSPPTSPLPVKSSSPPASPLPVKGSSPTKKSILAGILPSLPSKFSGVMFSRSKNQAKNNSSSNKETKVQSNSKTSKKTVGVSLPIAIVTPQGNANKQEVSHAEKKESLNEISPNNLLGSSPELSPQPRLRKRQSVERRARGKRQAVAHPGSESSDGPAPSPEIIRKELIKSRPNTLELNDEDGHGVTETSNVSAESSTPRRRALSTPTRANQMIINESEIADAIKSRKERYDSTGEELAHDDYSSSDDEPFMEIPETVKAAQKAERERVCQNQAVKAAQKVERERKYQLNSTNNATQIERERFCAGHTVTQKADRERISQSLPNSVSSESKKVTYEVVSLGTPLPSGKGLTELANVMKSMQNRVCRRSSIDGYEELDRTPVNIHQDKTATNDHKEGATARKVDRLEIEKIISKSKLVKKLSLSSEPSASNRLSDIQSTRDYEGSLRSDIVCENTVKLKLHRVPSGNLKKHETTKVQDGRRSPKNEFSDCKGQDVDCKGNKKPIPLPRSYLNRDSGHESSNDEKSGSSANTSPSSTLYKARNLNVTPIINIAMEKCQIMREKQNTEVVIQGINGNDTYMNVMMKPRQNTRDRYYENVAIEQVLHRSESPNPSPIPKRRVRHVSGADSESSSSSETSLSPNQSKTHLSQHDKQETCRYSGDCGGRLRGDMQNPRPVPAPRYQKDNGETHHDKSWYFGKMPRQECENLLLSLAKPCQFLVRDSSHRAGDLMLSVLFGRKVHHYLIQTTQDEKFSIAHHDFNSVSEIIDFYSTHVIMYSTKNDPIYLGEPFIKH